MSNAAAAVLVIVLVSGIVVTGLKREIARRG